MPMCPVSVMSTVLFLPPSTNRRGFSCDCNQRVTYWLDWYTLNQCHSLISHKISIKSYVEWWGIWRSQESACPWRKQVLSWVTCRLWEQGWLLSRLTTLSQRCSRMPLQLPYCRLFMSYSTAQSADSTLAFAEIAKACVFHFKEALVKKVFWNTFNWTLIHSFLSKMQELNGKASAFQRPESSLKAVLAKQK